LPTPLLLRRSDISSVLRDSDAEALRGSGAAGPPVAEAHPTLSVLNVPLAVRLVTSLTDRHVSTDVRSLQFRSVVPGGYAACELQLDRPMTLQPDELALYGDVYVYDGRTGDVVWQGRMEDPGRGAGGQGEVWAIRAVGPAAHARDGAVKLLYVDKALGRWHLMGYSCANANADGFEDQQMADASDAPGARFRALRGTVLATSDSFGRHYRELNEAGQDLARLSYDWDAGQTSAWMDIESVARTGIAGGGDVAKTSTFNIAGGSHVAVVGTDFTAGRDVAEIRIQYTGGGGTIATDTCWGLFSNIVVMARRYTKAGVLVTSYTADTVTADEIVADLLGRLLDQYDGDNAVIAACTFDIEQLAYPDGATPAEVLADLVRLEPDFYWAAWSGKPARFEWSTWPTAVGYEATTKEGFDSPGSAADLFNAVSVRWTDVDGRLRTTVRTSTVIALDDAGLTRTARVDLGDEVGTLADAQQAGDEFLAQHGAPPNAGTLRVSSPILSIADNRMVDPWEIIPGRLIRVRDVVPRVDALNPTARDAVTVFRVVAVTYDAATNTATLELDSSPRTVEQMLSAADQLVGEGRRRR
jgi:hypothetical protein